jgi:hypothetical protein
MSDENPQQPLLLDVTKTKPYPDFKLPSAKAIDEVSAGDEVTVWFFESESETARRGTPNALSVEVERREGDLFYGWTDDLADDESLPIVIHRCNIGMIMKW